MQTRLSTSSLNPTRCPRRRWSDLPVFGEIAGPRDEVDGPAERAAPPRPFQLRRRLSRTD